MLGLSKYPGDSHPLRLLALLLAAAVILPTVCLLWFMQQAVKNERLAVRQRLIDLYQGPLAEIAADLDGFWREQIRQIDELAARTAEAGPLFAALVHERQLSPAAVILDAAGGRMLYPSAATPTPTETMLPPAFTEAERLEFEQANYAAAAETYKTLADNPERADLAVRALFGRARCLLKARRHEEALQIYLRDLQDEKFKDARDTLGTPLSMIARIKALELLIERAPDQAGPPAETLCDRACDYEHLVVGSSCRVFLLEKVRELLDRLDGGRTAGEDPRRARLQSYIEAENASLSLREHLEPQRYRLGRDAVRRLNEDTYVLCRPTGTATIACLYPRRRMRDICRQLLPAAPSGVRYAVTDDLGRTLWPDGPDGPDPTEEPFIKTAAGDRLGGWQVQLYLTDAELFSRTADRQITLYLWAGCLVVTLILAAGAYAVRSISRQYRLHRMKNDFVATISHELKTPLAGMRVLVDTLREGRYHDQRQVTEYLQLISKENARLTRLIDTFLSFSRMERNKRSFDMTPADPAGIARDAAEAVQTKFTEGHCRLDLEIADDLPEIFADRDALVTVLINLLDNACKYTGDDKQIRLRTFGQNGFICFEVADNGAGISKRAMKKIFQRFYQSDRTLARRVEGCGLGLSIVRFIVDAHQGSVRVDSRPGKGSTFTVWIPVCPRGNGQRQRGHHRDT